MLLKSILKDVGYTLDGQYYWYGWFVWIGVDSTQLLQEGQYDFDIFRHQIHQDDDLQITDGGRVIVCLFNLLQNGGHKITYVDFLGAPLKQDC